MDEGAISGRQDVGRRLVAEVLVPRRPDWFQNFPPVSAPCRCRHCRLCYRLLVKILYAGLESFGLNWKGCTIPICNTQGHSFSVCNVDRNRFRSTLQVSRDLRAVEDIGNGRISRSDKDEPGYRIVCQVSCRLCFSAVLEPLEPSVPRSLPNDWTGILGARWPDSATERSQRLWSSFSRSQDLGVISVADYQAPPFINRGQNLSCHLPIGVSAWQRTNTLIHAVQYSKVWKLKSIVNIVIHINWSRNYRTRCMFFFSQYVVYRKITHSWNIWCNNINYQDLLSCLIYGLIFGIG